MPRVGRKAAGGVIYHVLNRANGGARLFDTPADYDAFVALIARTKAAVPGVRVLAYCLMPNHWHLVLWPRGDGGLSSFMLRLCPAHSRRGHAHRRAAEAARAARASRASQSTPVRRNRGAEFTGHLYQGRFK